MIGRGRAVVVAPSQGVGGAQVAAAGDGQLEAVDVESLLVGVGQQPDEVVFLQAGGGVVGVQVAAGRPRVHALLQPLGLGVLLIPHTEPLGVVLVWQVDDHLPLPVCVGGSLGSPVEDIGRTEIAACLVVVLGVGVTTETKIRYTDWSSHSGLVTHLKSSLYDLCAPFP